MSVGWTSTEFKAFTEVAAYGLVKMVTHRRHCNNDFVQHYTNVTDADTELYKLHRLPLPGWLSLSCTMKPTNVSQTIRKAPFAEAQTAFKKNKKHVLWNVAICPITEILWQTATLRKISLKSSNQLLSRGQKTTFKTADVRHLEFLKCSYLVIWLSSSSKCAVVYRISSKLDDFSLRYGALTIYKSIGHLEFSKLRVRHVTSVVAKLFCFPVQSFTEIGQSAAELWPKTIFKMAGSTILNFKHGLVSCYRVPNLRLCRCREPWFNK